MRDDADEEGAEPTLGEEGGGEHTSWHRSILLVYALWAMTLLPAGLPRASASWGEATSTGTVTAWELRELSGLAVSGLRPDVFWAHNDSGDAPRLYLLGRGGELMGSFTLDVRGAYDWEDIASGPCEAGSSRRCLFVGDVGDNKHRRERSWVWRVEEPDPWAVTRGEVGAVRPEHVWVFTHEGRAHDAEGLFVDPNTARPYVVQKSRRGPTRIMALPEAAEGFVTRGEARAIGELELRSEPTRSGRLATAADMTRAGKACVGVRTYAWVWTTCSADRDASVEELIGGVWERTGVGAMFQSEALAFEADASGALISSEGWLAPIVRVPAR